MRKISVRGQEGRTTTFVQRESVDELKLLAEVLGKPVRENMVPWTPSSNKTVKKLTVFSKGYQFYIFPDDPECND